MKVTTALTFAISLSLGSLSAQQGAAQQCPAQQGAAQQCKGAAKAACTAQSQCSANKDLAKTFQALEPAQQKKVSAALVGMMKMCPMGSKVPGTIASLDRLYTDAITRLTKVVKEEKVPAAVRADVQKDLVALTKLASLNQEMSASLKLVAGAATSDCCDAKTDSKDCATKDCATEDCAFTCADKLTKAWGGAKAELAKLSQCKDSMAKMKGYMAVLEQNKLGGLQKMVAANFAQQAALLKSTCGEMACPHGGLLAKHKDVMKACSFTNENCSGSVKAVLAAQKLLSATPFAVPAAPAAPATGATKSGCCGGAAKGECAGKGECSGKGKGACKDDLCDPVKNSKN